MLFIYENGEETLLFNISEDDGYRSSGFRGIAIVCDVSLTISEGTVSRPWQGLASNARYHDHQAVVGNRTGTLASQENTVDGREKVTNVGIDTQVNLQFFEPKLSQPKMTHLEI